MANLTAEQRSFLWATRLLRTLHTGGVRHFVSSPGFRNSPLVLALLQLAEKDPSFQVYSHMDERGAAFFALGLAKAAREPAVVFCTSGTAAANYYPAVLEAEQAQVSLVVVTADRPAELIGIGANQAFDQQNLYGQHLRFSAHVPPAAPVESLQEWDHMEYTVARAVGLSQGSSPGPVHLNCAFREPFLLGPSDKAAVAAHQEITKPRQRFVSEIEKPSAESILRVAMEWSRLGNVLVAVGPGEWSADDRAVLRKFSRMPNTVVVAEAASGLGFGAGPNDAFLLRAENLFKDDSLPVPSLLLRFGAPLTGRGFEKFQQRTQAAGSTFWIFDGSLKRNPNLGAATFFGGSISGWFKGLSEMNKPVEGDEAWRAAWLKAEQTLEAKLGKILAEENFLTEWHISRALAEYLPADGNLFLGNSMPIRDFNTTALRQKNDVSLFSNRGLSGIDGLISTALGVARATRKPSIALLGDLSTLHDISALSLAKRLEPQIDFELWVINNQGGEIFRVVRTNTWPDLEKWFTTPQQLDFASLARGFGLDYVLLDSREKLSQHIKKTQASGVRIVEFKVGENNSAIRRRLTE